MGFIATNTIGQTTTKKVGLDWMVAHGGIVFAAAPSRAWPGEAAVIVSHVWLHKGEYRGDRYFNGKPCEFISNELAATRPELARKPTNLRANTDFCYEGSKLAGTGFFLESQLAAEMISADSRNADVVKRCVGGRNVNEMINVVEPRWVIDMEERSKEEAKEYYIPFQHLEEHVKPQRLERDAERYPRMVLQWWKYFHARQGLYRYIRTTGIERVLARSRVCGRHMIRFVPSSWVFTEGVVVFCFDDFSSYGVLQSTVHDLWLTKYSSTMKLDVRYVPLSCFRPFPFPPDWRASRTLGCVGRECYEFRENLIITTKMGLTATYNRFHDPEETSSEIQQLRELHEAMDRAVLEAYGWDDLAQSARCEFLLDYEEENDEDSAKKSRKKKPWRLRWPDDFRDEVLARLLALNAERAEQERLQGPPQKKAARPKTRKAATEDHPEFDFSE
ncbi:MAG: hypothetical protein HN341_17210 [Verrucomicrobia bacterium]|nr:hypothetical protein [Verrucomicrobiota bacterium]